MVRALLIKTISRLLDARVVLNANVSHAGEIDRCNAVRHGQFTYTTSEKCCNVKKTKQNGKRARLSLSKIARPVVQIRKRQMLLYSFFIFFFNVRGEVTVRSRSTCRHDDGQRSRHWNPITRLSRNTVVRYITRFVCTVSVVESKVHFDRDVHHR